MTITIEKIFFLIILLLCAWTGYSAIPYLSIDSADAMRYEAIQTKSGNHRANMETLLTLAAKSLQEVAPSDRDPLRLEESLNSSHRSIDEKPKNVFTPKEVEFLPMSPIELRSFDIPELPGFMPALGVTPQITMQSRPIPKANDPVSLERGEGSRFSERFDDGGSGGDGNSNNGG